MSFGRPYFSQKKMLELDLWWQGQVAKAKAEGRWPVKWEPNKRKRRGVP